MRSYTVERMDGSAWGAVPMAYIDHFPWPGGYAPFSFAQATWSENGLTLRMQTDEKPRFATLRGFTEEVYTQNAIELFLMPDPANDARYYNWEFSPAGAMFHSIGEGRPGRTPLCPDGWEKLFRVETEVSAAGWGLTFYVPFTYIKEHFPAFAPKAGHAMRGNFFKIADRTDTPHYGCWAYVGTETPDFHSPDYFGDILLG